MSLRVSRAAAAALAAALLPLCGLAQTPPVVTPVPAPASPAPEASVSTSATGERIIGIRVVGYQTVTPDTIAHYLGIKAGDPYDPEKIRERFRALWDVGLLENLSIEAERSAAGVTLVITIEERPVVQAVDFEGNKKLSASQIRDRLKEEHAEVRVGGPLSVREIAKARSKIAEYYLQQGYRSADVSYKIEDVSKTEKRVIFEIDEGDKVKIESIEFEGNTVLSDGQLKGVMKETKTANLLRTLSEKTVWNQANYEADVELIKQLYWARGYKDVVVKDPVVEPFVVDPSKPEQKQKRRVKIKIPIVEGEQFFVNELKVVRVEQTGQPADPPDQFVLPSGALRNEFSTLTPGSVLNRDLIVEALGRIETRYRARGYIYWYGNPQYKEIGDHKVDVEIQLYEGDKFYLGRLEVKGNSVTRDKVIRRQFALDEGDVLNMEAVKSSLLKLQQLGYFKVTEEPDFSVRPQDKKVDITIKGTEASKNEIQFGAGYSALDGFFGQFSFQTRNFLGRGEVLGAAAQIGKISNYYDLSYTIPWWLDKNQSVGLSIYSRDVEYINIDESRQGFSLLYGKGLGLFSQGSLLFQWEDVLAKYPVTGAPVPPGQPPPPTTLTDVTGRTSSITPGFRYDSRNDPMDPNRGWSLYGSVQLAGEFLGGNVSFVKPLVGYTRYVYVPFLRNSYVGLNIEGGYVDSFSDSELPVFERFQLGGEQSLRGFRAGAVIPLTEDNQVFTDQFGRILGGNKYFVLNLEYTFLSVGPAKLLIFTDIGNTYHESQNFDITYIRQSVGAELRVFLPIFQAPLRFIYSWNLDPKTPIDQFGFPLQAYEERRSGFDFSIGRTF
ncbi:MAG TPA: outer membrane protein assembly factor BamA [Thermoanaerobaculia bacterium]